MHASISSKTGLVAVASVLGVCVMVGCKSSGSQDSVPAASTPNNTPSPPIAAPVAVQPASGPANPGSVASLGSLAPGAEVRLRAGFFGWRGPCRGDPPTRSAWQLADAATPGAPCVYVDGPMPAGFTPAGGNGQAVEVEGTLMEFAGVRYVQARSARPSP